MNMTTDVDIYFVDGCGRCELGGTPQCKTVGWRDELEAMRTVMLKTDLVEECKWGVPCYTIDGKNVATLSALKDSVRLGFFKGVLLKDENGLLEFAGENSQSGKHLSITSVDKVERSEDTILSFVSDAIDVERNGLKIDFKEKDNLVLTNELKNLFTEDPELEKAFFNLTPGRQRGYILYFSAPKKTETRVSRIIKFRSKILAGKGFHDR